MPQGPLKLQQVGDARNEVGQPVTLRSSQLSSRIRLSVACSSKVVCPTPAGYVNRPIESVSQYVYRNVTPIVLGRETLRSEYGFGIV
jgi:hypothetical protein